MNETRRNALKVWPAVVFGAIMLILGCLIVKLFLEAEVSTPLVIAICAISGLMILSPRIFELTELIVSKEGIVAKIRDVEQKAESAKQGVKEAEKKIDQLFAYTMSDSMFENLRKLASG